MLQRVGGREAEGLGAEKGCRCRGEEGRNVALMCFLCLFLMTILPGLLCNQTGGTLIEYAWMSLDEVSTHWMCLLAASM